MVKLSGKHLKTAGIMGSLCSISQLITYLIKGELSQDTFIHFVLPTFFVVAIVSIIIVKQTSLKINVENLKQRKTNHRLNDNQVGGSIYPFHSCPLQKKRRISAFFDYSRINGKFSLTPPQITLTSGYKRSKPIFIVFFFFDSCRFFPYAYFSCWFCLWFPLDGFPCC